MANVNYHLEKEEPVVREIRKYLQARGISQRELAEVIIGGLAKQMNYRLNNKGSLSLGEYIAICDYLEVPHDFFMRDDYNR